MKKKGVLWEVFVLLIAALLVSALMPLVTESEKALVVLSGSMTPVMQPGDMIVVKSVDPNELKVGDVVAFRLPWGKPDILVTHRIISIEEGKERLFQTKGDANNINDDSKVLASNVVGKLIFVIPFLGYLTEASKAKNIFFFMVMLPACLLILDEIWNLIIYSNPTRARKKEYGPTKMARCTSYVIRGKKLAVIILINGLLLTGMVAQNLGENGHVVLGGKNTIENPGALSSVYVFIPDNSEQRLTINPWYGVVSPANKTQVISPENTPAKIISVPYILPVFWVITLAEINPYLPAAVEVILYSSVFTLLLFPLWYKKSVIGGNGKKIRLHRLIIQWKRNLRLVKRY